MNVLAAMTGRSHEHEALLERAAEWHARLRADDAGTADHAGFAAWLAADTRHRLAYADVCAAAYALESAAPALTPTLTATPRARTERRRGVWLGAFAGSALAFLVALGAWFGPAPWQNLTNDAWTRSGEQRTLELPDGSRVVLDGDSAIDIAYVDGERRIELARGAAFFEVEPDATRPFVVQADGARAVAVGTRYAVERIAGRVAVHVEEGIVEVSSDAAPGVVRRLVAGEGVVVVDGAAPGEVARGADAALAWTRQRLVFSATPLAEALARLDRHLPGRVVMLGRPRADARVTAAIPASDAAGGLEAIAREHGLALRQVPGLGYVVY